MFFNNKIASYKEDTDIDFYPPVTTPPPTVIIFWVTQSCKKNSCSVCHTNI